MPTIRAAICMLLASLTLPWVPSALAQPAAASKKKPPPFAWVNVLPEARATDGLSHNTFHSPSMDLDVGYCIYLPPSYAEETSRRYPVVYYLHGGRPGSELKAVNLVPYIDRAIRTNTIPDTIYVFVNGGPISHYNEPQRDNAQGEDVFIQELIPHIDTTYRTIANRSGRGLEGFSQGGRGTMRISLKHPHLFCSAAAGGGGYATEKRISEEGGRESDQLVFAEGDNTWDLARTYVAKQMTPFRLLIFVGTKGFNYENNLEYMSFLESLGIPFERLIVEEAPHSARDIYEKQGDTVLKFHAVNFAAAQHEVIPANERKAKSLSTN